MTFATLRDGKHSTPYLQLYGLKAHNRIDQTLDTRGNFRVRYVDEPLHNRVSINAALDGHLLGVLPSGRYRSVIKVVLEPRQTPEPQSIRLMLMRP